MKQINFFIVVAVLILMVTGCGTKKPATVYKKTYDTLIIEKNTTYRDTVFVTEKAKTSVISNCDSLTGIPKTSKNKNATQKLYKDKEGNIIAECECDSLAIAAKIKQEYVKENHTTNTTEIQIQKEKYTPVWIQVLAWIGGVFLTYIIIYIIVKKAKK